MCSFMFKLEAVALFQVKADISGVGWEGRREALLAPKATDLGLLQHL